MAHNKRTWAAAAWVIWRRMPALALSAICTVSSLFSVAHARPTMLRVHSGNYQD